MFFKNKFGSICIFLIKKKLKDINIEKKVNNQNPLRHRGLTFSIFVYYRKLWFDVTWLHAEVT